jgi:hypothetical protein
MPKGESAEFERKRRVPVAQFVILVGPTTTSGADGIQVDMAP